MSIVLDFMSMTFAAWSETVDDEASPLFDPTCKMARQGGSGLGPSRIPCTGVPDLPFALSATSTCGNPTDSGRVRFLFLIPQESFVNVPEKLVRSY